jgi:hypothetical protein
MAVTTVSTGLNQVYGIKYTVITDTSADWASVSNSTYFYDKEDRLPYFKNSSGVVVKVFGEMATQETTSTATLTINSNLQDLGVITAQAAALTIAAPTGTPIQGQKLIFRIKDNGTARAITWNAIFRIIGTTLPTTTVINKTTYVGCIYNSTDTKWDVVVVNTEA